MESQQHTVIKQEPIVLENALNQVLNRVQASILGTLETLPASGEYVFSTAALDQLTMQFLKLHGVDRAALPFKNLSSSLAQLELSMNGAAYAFPNSDSAQWKLIGDLCNDLYRRHGRLEDLNLAIEGYKQASSCPHITASMMTSSIMTLGAVLTLRFGVTGEASDLQLALQYLTQALPLAHNDKSVYPKYLFNLGVVYRLLFRHLSQPEDLDTAIQYLTQAESELTNDSPDIPIILSTMSDAILDRYALLRQLDDLNVAIEYRIKANTLLPRENSLKSVLLYNLGLLYKARHDRLGDTADLDYSIMYMRKAVSLNPDGYPGKSETLNSLGLTHLRRYECLKELSDLDSAVECLALVVNLLPDIHRRKPEVLEILGFAYWIRYQHLGLLADLDTSISLLTQALHLNSNEQSDRPRMLTRLGNSYETRFMRLHRIQDIDQAIHIKHEAVLLASNCSHPERPRYLTYLGIAYIIRYRRTGQPTDLEAAVNAHHRALLLTPEGNEEKPTRLGNLGTAYSELYTQTEQPQILDVAIDYVQQAVSLAPKNYSDTPVNLINLGSLYYTRYDCLKQLGDLDMAIEYSRLGISSSHDHPFYTMEALMLLGDCLSRRYAQSHDTADLLRSIEYFKRAALTVSVDPQRRTSAAYKWAQECINSNQPQSAMMAYRCLVSLIPQVVWLGMTIEQRYVQVTGIAYKTLEAAVVAAICETYDEALEWLEQGRSIVWSQLLQLHSPLDELQTVDNSLYEELVQTANELQGLCVLQSPTNDINRGQALHEAASQRHHRLVERWERLVQRAQSLPGMCHLFAPANARQLANASHNRTIVIVLVLEAGSAALAIRPNTTEIISIPLLSFSSLKALEARELLRQASSSARGERKVTKAPMSDQEHNSILGMLWEDIAKPVLDHLGYLDILPVEDLPHITWCTTGPLSFLPLHAAGDYTKPHSSLFDCCISSFTPTLGVLLKPPPDPATFSGIAMISQESTSGFPSLPGTVQELNRIAEKVEHIRSTRLEGGIATRTAVVNAMESHSWIHIACHASQNLANPIASAFHLHDGPLDLGTITRKHLKHADLAFLSACQTATGDMELSEEAVHLAAGMIMAGYRTVIATMWPIRDEDAPLVADRFYEYMLKDGVPDSRKAARALHYAVVCLRDKVGVKDYKRWAPYIHLGI